MEDYFKDMLKNDSPSLEAKVERVKIPSRVRKFFSGYLSLGILLGGLGVGMARGDERDKPVYIGQHSDKETTMVVPAQEFSLASQPQSGFSLARAAQSNTLPAAEPSVSLVETPLPAPNRTLDSFVTTYDTASVKPNELAYTTVNKAEQPKAAEAKQPEKKKHYLLLKILGAAAVVVGGYYGIKALLKKHEPEPIPHPTYKETTTTLNVKNVLTNQTLSGILLEYDDIDANSNTVHETYTTDAGGNATISYKEGTQPNLTVSGANFVTRSTYVKWLSNDLVTLMPTSFDTNTFDVVARESERSAATHVTKRLTKQFKYYIVNDNMDNDTRQKIKDYLKTNGQELGSGGKIKGTTSPEEGPLSSQPGKNSYYFIFEYRDDFNIDTWAITDTEYDTTTYEITRVIVKFNSKIRGPVDNPTSQIPASYIAHECFHGLGHAGHGHKFMLMSLDNFSGYITQIDIDNGTVMYNRPCGNSAPDNDPAEGGATDTAIAAAMTALSLTPMTNMFSRTTMPGSQGVYVGSFKLPGKQSGKATLHDIVAMLPDMQVQDGKFGLALNPAMGQVKAGFGDDNAGVAAALTNNGYGPADFTAAAQMREGAFTAAAQYSTSSGNLQAGASIAAAKGIEVMVFDAYDARRQANTFNIGTSLFDRKLQVSYGFQTASNLNVQVLNAQTQFGFGEVLVDASGSVAKYSPDDVNMALNVSAHLGKAMILGSYNREQLGEISRDYAKLSAVVPFGPHVLIEAGVEKMFGLNPSFAIKGTWVILGK